VEACGRLVANRLGGAALPGEVARAIAEAAGGNPLFVEELVAELLDGAC
jgi:predicted ATPase